VGHGAVFSWVTQFSYPAVFVALLACGLGAPLSEELVLLTAGLVVAQGQGHLGFMIAVAFAGTLGGDLSLYTLGRTVGLRALSSKWLTRILTPARVSWIEGHFHRHGAKTVLVARFLPGLRAATFLVAGISRLSGLKFLVADGLGALISVPLLTWLGYRFGVSVLKDVKVASRWILCGVALLVLGLMVRKVIQRRRRMAAGLPEVAAEMLREELRENSP